MDRSNPAKVKAVILDYGEVLCYPPSAQEMGRMGAPFGMDPVPFRKLWDRDRLCYDRGDLSPEAYWAGLAKDTGTQLTPEQFDHLTFSAEVSLIKPDAAIYEHSLRGVGMAASEALFIDDKEPNVQGARAVGIRAIRFQSIEQLRSELRELGFPFLPADQ